MFRNIIILSLLFIIASSSAACPHQDSSLIKFSSVSSWNSLNAKVVISSSQRVLLDVSPHRQLTSIEINEINLDVQWIKVNNGGKFIAGSTSCKINNKVIITFHGNRSLSNSIGTDPADYSPFGTKGMAVATGGTLELHGHNSGPSWTRLAATARAGDSSIVLENSVSWRADKLVLATTDFSGVVDTKTYPSNWTSVSWARGIYIPDQTEEIIVKSISGGKTITLSSPLKYTHWGQGFEKAEVGLLTRYIVFRGDEASVSQEFGGHLILRHAKQLHIQGVEFTRFGQKGVLARYLLLF